jgi:hypothetical protein
VARRVIRTIEPRQVLVNLVEIVLANSTNSIGFCGESTSIDSGQLRSGLDSKGNPPLCLILLGLYITSRQESVLFDDRKTNLANPRILVLLVRY